MNPSDSCELNQPEGGEAILPIWVKLACALVAALILCSLVRVPRAVVTSIAISSGRKHYAEGRFDLAVPAFERAANADPRSSEVILLLAESYLRAGRPLDAARQLDKLVGRSLDDRQADRAFAVGKELNRFFDQAEGVVGERPKPR